MARRILRRTPQQKKFIRALIDTPDHLALVARAGCGKTSTILEGFDSLAKKRPSLEVGVCAFNKAIADEVSQKLRDRGHTNWKQYSAATLHSMGWGLVKFAFNLDRDNINDNKVRDLVDQVNNPISDEYHSQIVALVKMAKQAGFGFFADLPISDTGKWHELADHYDINGLDDTTQSEEIVEAAQHVYKESLHRTDIIDFDDMILFPLVKNLRVKFTKDVLFVDEAQDLSRTKQALARKFLSRTGRMIIVGDDRQAIYGFSGADAAALHNLIEQLGAVELPLSVTWRCPKKVVELARTIVPDIEAAPSAKEGEVIHISSDQPKGPYKVTSPILENTPETCQLANGTVVDEITTHSAECRCTFTPQGKVSWYETLEDPLKATDAILCRNTAPLISTAHKLIRAGVRCKVEGRAIGENLKTIALRWKIKTIDTLLKRLENYEERERQKALAKGNEQKAEEVTDRVETLREICKACIEKGRTDLSDVVAFIDDLFADGVEDATTLATYHRSKGREWPRVFLLEHHDRCPSKAARQAWQIEQEHNLAYVAFTRSQNTLVFVNA